MVLVEVQQYPLPIAGELVARTDAPIVILDLRAQLRNHALDADRTHVPPESRFLDLLHPFLSMRRGNLGAASIECSSLLRSHQPPDFFDERRQGGLSIGCDSQVHFGIVSVVVNI